MNYLWKNRVKQYNMKKALHRRKEHDTQRLWEQSALSRLAFNSYIIYNEDIDHSLDIGLDTVSNKVVINNNTECVIIP